MTGPGATPARWAVTGVRPLGYPGRRTRVVVAGLGWLVAAVALAVGGYLPASSEVPSLVAEAGLVAGLVTGVVLTSQVVRYRVEITVAAGEVRVGELHLPRAGLGVEAEGPADAPRALRLSAPGRQELRLGATRWLVPWPGSGHGAQVLVPQVRLGELATELTGPGSAAPSFGLRRSGRATAPDFAPVLLALAAIGLVSVVGPLFGRVGSATAAALDVGLLSVGFTATSGRIWPRPVLRQLVITDREVTYLDIYRGRLLGRVDRSEVAVERRVWWSRASRMFPAVPHRGIRINLGGRLLDVGFPEPLPVADRTPRQPMPQWTVEPGQGDRLVAALRGAAT